MNDEDSAWETREVSLTLHSSVWKAIENEMEGGAVALPDLIRSVLAEAYWDKMQLMGLPLPLYPNNKPSYPNNR